MFLKGNFNLKLTDWQLSKLYIFEKNRCMCNTLKDLSLPLNHGPSYHFNIKMSENIKFWHH